MLSNDLIQIKNSYMARKDQVVLPYSPLTHEVVRVLSKRGYVGEVKVVSPDSEKGRKEGALTSTRKNILVELLYTQGVRHLNELRFLSKPGRKIYSRASKLRKVRQGFGDLIISTSQGIMSGNEARRRHVGGEVICEVF